MGEVKLKMNVIYKSLANYNNIINVFFLSKITGEASFASPDLKSLFSRVIVLY